MEQAVLDAVHDRGYEGPDAFAVKLALEEALANAIKHGNRNDPRKLVEVRIRVTDEEVRITVCDEGAGFDLGAVPDPTLDENLTKPFGRGVMLMRTYMTHVEYNDAGNCVTMIKRRQSQADPGGA